MQSKNQLRKRIFHGKIKKRKYSQFFIKKYLKVFNTMLKKDSNRWTWQSLNHEIHNEIDYILTNLILSKKFKFLNKPM